MNGFSDGCKGKHSYATQRAAANARQALIRRKNGTSPGGKVNIYACQTCDGWHIGHARRHLFTRPKRGGDLIRTKLQRYLDLVGGET